MTNGFACRHFSIGLPEDAADQSLTALFRHVSETLAESDPISMDDIIAVTFPTELGQDAVFRGAFTVVFTDDEHDVSTAASSPADSSQPGSAAL
ncbi:hypothetical protein [Kribbella sp. NPDC000426]|uniref:hypothetical protein n=1 Tax=Kribbella sp. NPDC000426 TaxID=3154255 RepID=UPI00332FF5DF